MAQVRTVKGSTVFITGGAGFLGSHVADRCLREGARVICADNLVTGNVRNISHNRENPSFVFRDIDVSSPYSPGEHVDFVLHFASPASPPGYQRFPLETLRVNTEGTRIALDLAERNDATFFFASTSEIYGDPTESPQSETYWGNVNTFGERCMYDEGKRAGEAFVWIYRNVFGVDAKLARFFNTYGPRMDINDGRVVPNFIKQALTGKPLTIYGDGLQTRSFCYVDDLVEGIYRLICSDYDRPVNLGNPVERTMLDFARFVNRAFDRAEDDFVHVEALADDPKQRKPDISRAKQVLGWEPQVPFEEGFARTVDYFKGLG